jgi:acetyltransferase-like isoleucine patch superfamily enzyme
MMKFLHKFVRWCPGAAGFLIRRKYYPFILGECGKKVIFGRYLNFNAPENISIGDNTILNNFVTISAGSTIPQSRQVVLEHNVFIGTFSTIKAEQTGRIIIREGVNVSSCCEMFSTHLLEIERDTLLAAYCRLGIHVDEESTDKSGQLLSETKVGDSCWLGVRVQQVAGSEIGRQTVVGAHAFVHHDLDSYGIAIGRPAEIQRKRSVER